MTHIRFATITDSNLYYADRRGKTTLLYVYNYENNGKNKIINYDYQQ